MLIDQVIERYGGIGTTVFDPSTVNANEALKGILRVFMLIFFFFSMVPFLTYLVFMSSLDGKPRSYEISWKRIIQIYGYSMACFIPGILLYIILAPFDRAKWVLTFGLTSIVCYY